MSAVVMVARWVDSGGKRHRIVAVRSTVACRLGRLFSLFFLVVKLKTVVDITERLIQFGVLRDHVQLRRDFLRLVVAGPERVPGRLAQTLVSRMGIEPLLDERQELVLQILLLLNLDLIIEAFVLLEAVERNVLVLENFVREHDLASLLFLAQLAINSEELAL